MRSPPEPLLPQGEQTQLLQTLLRFFSLSKSLLNILCKLLAHLIAHLSSLCFGSLSSRRLWETASNALLKSR